MGYVMLTCNCAACGVFMQCNPAKVPSLPVNGQREAICRSCFGKWNEIHRTSKGLPPEPLQPNAYGWGIETDFEEGE